MTDRALEYLEAVRVLAPSRPAGGAPDDAKGGQELYCPVCDGHGWYLRDPFNKPSECVTCGACGGSGRVGARRAEPEGTT